MEKASVVHSTMCFAALIIFFVKDFYKLMGSISALEKVKPDDAIGVLLDHFKWGGGN